MAKDSRTILSVENDTDVREIIVEIVEALGYSCLEAKSAFEAREIVEKQVVDLIHLDIHGSIGVEAASREQLERDRVCYADLRKRGFSDTQIRQAAEWTAMNIRGAKQFGLVKYCIEEALEE